MPAQSKLITNRLFQSVFLAGLVLAVYGLSLANGFVWDDNIFFIGKPVYRDFDLRAIFSSLSNGVEYLPLRDITYASDYLLWGESPLGFHFTNIIIFIINALLVYRLAELINVRIACLRNKAPSSFIPLATAALFAIHPINAEVANFITCRNVLVSGVFFFTACICFINFLEAPSKKKYSFVIIFFICSLLGKATAIMLPILLMATMPILFPGRLRQITIANAPLITISALFFFAFTKIAANAGIISKTGMVLTSSSLERKFALASQIPFFYLKKFLLPFGFSIEYVVDFSSSLISSKAILAFAASLLLTLLAFIYRSKAPEFLLAYLWFMAALIPVLNFFDTNPLLADRYAYLPVFGLSLGMAAAFDRITAIRLKSILAALLCLLLAGVSVTRSFDWRTDESLWKANIRNYPNLIRNYINLAVYYFNKGEQKKALDLLAANANVPWIELYNNYFIGCYELLQYNNAAAKAAFQKPLVVFDGFIGSLYNLGKIAELEGDYLSAVHYYNRALASEQNDNFRQLPIIRERLQEIRSKKLDRYILSLKQKVEANPADYAAKRDLALMFDQLGLYNDALEQFLALKATGLKSWQLLHNIADCYFNTNRSSDAIRYYEEVVALRNGDVNDFNNLGISYRKLKLYDKSAEVLQQALQKFPDAPYPAFNLGVTFYAAGSKEKARNSFNRVVMKFPALRDRAAPYLKELAIK